MSAETDVYAALSGYAPLVALVETRIYPDVLPEKCLYPAVVFAREKTAPVYSISNQYFGADVSLSIGCWAATRSAADTIASATIAAIAAAGMLPTGQSAGYDPETYLYAAVIELDIFET